MTDVQMARAIELWPVDRLKPYERNARTHDEAQVDKIAASMMEFGFTSPVLVDENDGIIAGHGRLMAAKKLGLTEIPVIPLTHMTDAQRRAYILADNRLALDAGWDNEMLAAELAALDEEGFDLELTGFSDEELADLLEDESPGDGQTDDDEVPGVPYFPTSVPGDVWVCGPHRVMCGDSTMIDAVERLMDGVKADMIFTDPPYGVDYEGINNDSRDGLRDLLDQAFANYSVAARPGAPIYVFHSDRCADIFHDVFRRYCHFSSMVIWVKPALVLSQTDYQSRHEPCMYGWIEGAPHNFHGDRTHTSIWEFGKESVEGHTTPKPVELVSYAIGNSSKKGAVVVDLFGGSGSTLIACEKTARQARIMELDCKYVDVIVQRWQQFTGRQAVHEQDGCTFDEMIGLRKPIDA